MFKAIVVGTDGSDTATQAVRQAVDLRGPVGAKLELVSAYEPVPAQRLQRSGATLPRTFSGRSTRARTSTRRSRRPPRWPARRESPSTCIARQGDPADAILDVAEEQEADLVVVGNKGMTGAKRFLLGSVPNKVSHHAPCSVLIIRTT